MTLSEFLLARIAEDEAVAREANTEQARTPYSDSRIPPVAPDRWGALVEDYLGDEVGDHCARHSPIRIFRECEAKRRIVDLQPWSEGGFVDGFNEAHALALSALALPYADHPDYQQEWRP